MGTPADNLVLELLRALRGDTVAIRADVTEVKHRLSNLEISVATIHGLIAHNAAETARQAAAQDRLAGRVERLEVRESFPGNHSTGLVPEINGNISG